LYIKAPGVTLLGEWRGAGSPPRAIAEAGQMIGGFAGGMGRLFGAAAIVGVVGLASAPQPAHAVSPGAAVGIGLGAFALGSILASPYYYPGYYPGYYYPPPAYYYPPAPPPAYYPAYQARSCWSPYYRQYVAC
jgi:hypothetical protein